MAIDWNEDIVITELSDEPALSDELSSLHQQMSGLKKTPHLVLNFAGVSYINSSNLAQLLRLRKLLAERARILKLCSVCDEIWSVFMLTGLDKVFRFAPDPLTALAGIQLEDTGGKK